MAKYYLAGEGAIWAQPDGPNTKPQFLGCHEVGSITQPSGTLNLVYCSDPSGPNKYKVVGSYKSAPGAVSTSIETVLSEVADYLERWPCPGTIFINKVECGRKDVFNAYSRSFVLRAADITSRSLDNLASRTPDSQQESMQSFEISAEELMDAFDLKAVRMSISETEAMNDIWACGEDTCAGPCGVSESEEDYLMAVGDAASGSPSEKADVMISEDGDTWDHTPTEPFAATEAIASVVCFPTAKATKRILVARGTTDAGNPAEVAYSDDDGATWTNVDVGTVNGQYATGPDSLFALDMFNIWLTTTGGYIYFSEDSGATWTAQESGVITAGDMNGVHFADEDNGYAVAQAGIVARTVDGGGTWSATTITSVAAGDGECVRALGEFRAWVGTDDGRIFYTNDAGVTWSERNFGGSGIGEVAAIDFKEELIGLLVHNDAGGTGTLYTSIDGGYSWQALTTPANSGLNSCEIIKPYLMYAAGEAHGGTSMILKVTD